MLTDFIDEIMGNMTYTEKIKFLDICERYPKIKKRILKELDKKDKKLKKVIVRARRFDC